METIYSLYIHLATYLYIHVHMYINYIHVYIYSNIYRCTDTYIYLHTSTGIHTYILILTTFIHTYKHTYTDLDKYIHTHMHTKLTHTVPWCLYVNEPHDVRKRQESNASSSTGGRRCDPDEAMSSELGWLRKIWSRPAGLRLTLTRSLKFYIKPGFLNDPLPTQGEGRGGGEILPSTQVGQALRPQMTQHKLG